MASKLKPPIILIGNTRSGATMVQKLMAVHPAIASWYEPNPIWLYADPGRAHDEFDESDATVRVQRYLRNQFLKYQQQNGNCTVFEKTPQNILRVPYVQAIFPEARYLFIVRDPFSFISSVEFKWQKTVTGKGILRRLKSTPLLHLHHYASRYLVQQYNKRILRRKYLKIWGPRYRGIHQDLKTRDQLTVIARQWAVCSRRAEEEISRVFDQGQLLRLRYEDFVEDPVADLERICAHCGLTLTGEMVSAAKAWVKSDRQHKWRRFDPRELARLLPEITAEMQRHGYEVPVEIARAGEDRRHARGALAAPWKCTRRRGNLPKQFT